MEGLQYPERTVHREFLRRWIKVLKVKTKGRVVIRKSELSALGLPLPKRGQVGGKLGKTRDRVTGYYISDYTEWLYGRSLVPNWTAGISLEVLEQLGEQEEHFVENGGPENAEDDGSRVA